MKLFGIVIYCQAGNPVNYSPSIRSKKLTRIRREIEVRLVDATSNDLLASNKSKEVTRSPHQFLHRSCSD
jgi:hypothetical protein